MYSIKILYIPYIEYILINYFFSLCQKIIIPLLVMSLISFRLVDLTLTAQVL